MRLLDFDSRNPYRRYGRFLPRRPYDIGESILARGTREVKPKEELKIASSVEPRSLPVSESETQDEKMSDATTSTPPSLASVHVQSLRIAALALDGKEEATNTSGNPPRYGEQI